VGSLTDHFTRFDAHAFRDRGMQNAKAAFSARGFFSRLHAHALRKETS